MIASEIDGVLCQSRPEKIRDNTCQYERWLQNVEPLITGVHIHHIITGRLRKFRKHTEEWLSLHDITFDILDMWKHEPQLRWYMDSLPKWKAGLYGSGECDVYRESDPAQAELIRRLTNKRVDLVVGD